MRHILEHIKITKYFFYIYTDTHVNVRQLYLNCGYYFWGKKQSFKKFYFPFSKQAFFKKHSIYSINYKRNSKMVDCHQISIFVWLLFTCVFIVTFFCKNIFHPLTYLYIISRDSHKQYPIGIIYNAPNISEIVSKVKNFIWSE